MKTARSPQEVRNAVFLASCPASDAIAWLADRETNYSTVMGTPTTRREDHLPEYILLRRKDAGIDVALAEHGRSQTVLRLLYERASSSLKVVLCSNASLFAGDGLGSGLLLSTRQGEHFLWHVVQRAPAAELRALCENPHLSSYFYSGLISSWPPQNGRQSMGEDRFRLVVEFLAGNPRLSTTREDSAERHYMDGLADYEYNKFFTDAWRLAEKAPVTAEWAHALGTLYQRLYAPYKPFDDVESVLERWRPKDEPQYGPFESLRKAIAKGFIEPSIEELKHSDPARRTAFIESFDPRSPAFRDLDWKELAAADEHWSFAAMINMKIWASLDARFKFRSQLWADSKKNSDLTGIGHFNEEAERLSKLHPEWFEDTREEDEEAGIPQEDAVDSLRSEVRSLIAEMKASRDALLTKLAIFVVGIVVGQWLF